MIHLPSRPYLASERLQPVLRPIPPKTRCDAFAAICSGVMTMPVSLPVENITQ